MGSAAAKHHEPVFACPGSCPLIAARLSQTVCMIPSLPSAPSNNSTSPPVLSIYSNIKETIVAYFEGKPIPPPLKVAGASVHPLYVLHWPKLEPLARALYHRAPSHFDAICTELANILHNPMLYRVLIPTTNEVATSPKASVPARIFRHAHVGTDNVLVFSLVFAEPSRILAIEYAGVIDSCEMVFEGYKQGPHTPRDGVEFCAFSWALQRSDELAERKKGPQKGAANPSGMNAAELFKARPSSRQGPLISSSSPEPQPAFDRVA